MEKGEMKINIKSILQMARGGIQELVDYEMGRVMDNILDANTKPTAKRKLTITLEFTPDDNRQMVAVASSVKSALATTNPVQTALYLSATDEGVVATEMTAQIPGQTGIFDAEQEPAPVLKVIRSA